MVIGFHVIIDSVNLIQSSFYQVQMTKLEIRNKDNQPTNARLSPTLHNLGEDVVLVLVGFWKRLTFGFEPVM